MTGTVLPTALVRVDPLMGVSGFGHFVACALGVLCTKMLGILAALGLQLLLARWLGFEAYGLYTSIGALLVMGTQVGKLGLDPATLRFVAAYRATLASGSLAGFRQFRRSRIRLSQVLVLAIGGGVLVLGQPWFSAAAWWAIAMAVVSLPLGILLEVSMAELRALGWTQRSELVVMVLRPATIALVVAGLIGSGWSSQAANAYAALALALLLLCVLARALMTYARRGEQLAPVDNTELNKWRSATAFFTWVALLQAVLTQADIGMVGLLLGNESASAYATAARLAQLASIGMLATTAVSAPLLASAFAQSDLQRLQQLAHRTALLAAVLMIPAIVVLATFGTRLLGIFGAPFVAGYLPLLILLCGQLVSALTGCAGYLLHMTGHHRDAALAQTLAAGTQLVLLAVLTPLLGVLGAALSSALCVAIWNLQAVWLVHRRLNINSTLFARDLYPSLLRP